MGYLSGLGILLVLLTSAGAQAEASAEKPVTCDDVQKPTCLPGTPESADWPVAVVYMHGLFETSGITDYCRGESENRMTLAAIAKKLKVRIAVPVANVQGKHHNWGTSRTPKKEKLSEVEAKAVSACGDELMDGRAMLAFSNGCYRATDMLKSGCGPIGEYAKFITLGCETAENGTRECDSTGATTLFHETDHFFLTNIKDLVYEKLKFLKAAGGAPGAAFESGTDGN